MNEAKLRALLERVRRGRTSPERAVEALRSLPFEDLGFAKIDHHRALRDGVGEVIFCEGKTPAQIGAIAKRHARLLATRADRLAAAAIRRVKRGAVYHAQARCVTLGRCEPRRGLVLIVTGGTSDLPVAEEARVTAEFAGCRTELIADVGTAGVHRLMHHAARLDRATVVIAVAGMEGALATVAAGVTSRPVIAVPTSVGYGAAFDGLAPLLAMMNACAPGVAVVNIDNGFGAAMTAARICGRS